MTNVPEIRFKGFTDAWEQQTLGEVLSEKITNGIMNQPGQNELNIKHINVVNLYSPGYIHLDELEYVNVTENDLKRCNVQVGDIFLTRSSLKVEGIAQANILLDEGNLVFDDHIMRLKLTDEFEPFFVKEALNHSPTKNQFMTKSKTGTMTTIGQDDISSSTLSYPSKSEQTAVGSFFRTLDNVITLHQRKLDGLKKLKKGYLQLMFPQAGECVPRIRFAGFSEPWEMRKLGELFTERSERSAEGELISVTINSGVVKSSALERKDNSSEDKSNYKKVEIGDIAYNSMRMWQGASGISNYSGILSPAYTVIIPNQGVNSLFFSYMFKLTKIIEIFQSSSQGLTSDTWSLKFPLLKEITVTSPCNDEQIAIGTFFRNFDEQITDQQVKMDKLKQLKAAYLQKMFV